MDYLVITFPSLHTLLILSKVNSCLIFFLVINVAVINSAPSSPYIYKHNRETLSVTLLNKSPLGPSNLVQVALKIGRAHV